MYITDSRLTFFDPFSHEHIYLEVSFIGLNEFYFKVCIKVVGIWIRDSLQGDMIKNTIPVYDVLSCVKAATTIMLRAFAL